MEKFERAARRVLRLVIATGMLSVLGVAGAALGAPDQARIVNGLVAHEPATAGALLHHPAGSEANALMICSGVLIGCDTFLTAAHCVEPDSTASHYFVYLQHAGVFAVSQVIPHPSYTDFSFPIADVAVVKLSQAVTGIAPAALNRIDPEPFVPEPGSIVGFGLTIGSADDLGILRAGGIESQDCPASVPAGAGNTEVICWAFKSPLGPAGEDSNTCSGDSGGPLFMDLGAGVRVAGVTSGGQLESCGLGDESYDANVFTYLPFIDAQLDPNVIATEACGSLPSVGDPDVTVLERDHSLELANPIESFSFLVNPGAQELRVGLNHRDDLSFDMDLYLRFGAPAGSTLFDCKIETASPFGACLVPLPEAGTWHVRVEWRNGSGPYQVTTAIFGGDPSVCGNGTPEQGEECDDGNANAEDGCTNGCTICGNGVVTAPETCDDGNLSSLDGCSASCQLQGAAIPLLPPAALRSLGLLLAWAGIVGLRRRSARVVARGVQ